MRVFGMAFLIGSAFLPSSASPRESREPERHGVKLSEWVRRLDSTDSGERNNAALVLSDLGESAAPATSALARRLRSDEDADIRRHAAMALGQIGRKAKESSAVLSHAASSDKNLSVWVWSARALSKVDPARTEEAVDVLVKLAAKGNGGLDRCNAIGGLGELGGKARRALPVLKAAAGDGDPEVLKATSDALKKVEPGRSLSEAPAASSFEDR